VRRGVAAGGRFARNDDIASIGIQRLYVGVFVMTGMLIDKMAARYLPFRNQAFHTYRHLQP